VSAGQRRFARRLWVEHVPPLGLDDPCIDGDALIDALNETQLSNLIELLKAQPYRRGGQRLEKR
jgi:hypothetical protein